MGALLTLGRTGCQQDGAPGKAGCQHPAPLALLAQCKSLRCTWHILGVQLILAVRDVFPSLSGQDAPWGQCPLRTVLCQAPLLGPSKLGKLQLLLSTAPH